MNNIQVAVNKEDKIKQLKKFARKTRDVRMKLRYDSNRLYLQGMSMKEIADVLDTTYYSVRNYVKAYQAYGIEGLEIKKPPGRSRRLTCEQERKLYDCIASVLPKDVGFAPFVNWTATLACQWVEKEMGITLSARGMRFVFERLGLSYTRPTYVLKKADPQKQAEFIEQFEELKKN